MTTPAIRTLSPADLAAAHALVSAQFGGTRYAARLLEQLHAAASGGEDEGLVLTRGTSLVGLALSGAVAGASDTTKVHLIAGSDETVCRDVANALAQRRIRLLVAEVPDDDAFAPMRSALTSAGFREEGLVPDWIADGIALRILTLRRG